MQVDVETVVLKCSRLKETRVCSHTHKQKTLQPNTPTGLTAHDVR